MRHDESGATATEYAFLLFFIALAIVVGTQAFGSQLEAAFSDASSSVGSAVSKTG